MGRLFGTDSVKGVAVTELTCEKVMQIGRAAAIIIEQKLHHNAKILVAKDTRISSDILEAALVSGICSAGAEAVILGTLPTPAVAFLAKKREADAGIMISASHSSMEYNGLILFSGNGCMLSNDTEEAIEALVLDTPDKITASLKNGSGIGKISYDKNAEWDYIRSIIKSVDKNLEGIRVAVDCANGAASVTAEKIFSGLGASLSLLNNKPNGVNINDKCGSICLDGLSRYVVENKCHIGVAFDGDADRCIAVDENGAVIDGDKLMAIFSKNMRDKGTLNKNTAVVTTMTNFGFSYFAKENNINVTATKSGNRYILDAMQTNGYNIGGEQNGHIFFRDFSTACDGQLTAVQLLQILKEADCKASKLASVMERCPQVIINVKIDIKWKERWKNDIEIEKIISDNEQLLGSTGRIVVRESGTEPLICVMIEGKRFDIINAVAVEIADKIKERCV